VTRKGSLLIWRWVSGTFWIHNIQTDRRLEEIPFLVLQSLSAIQLLVCLNRLTSSELQIPFLVLQSLSAIQLLVCLNRLASSELQLFES
jgi:hypothetical protein